VIGWVTARKKKKRSAAGELSFFFVEEVWRALLALFGADLPARKWGNFSVNMTAKGQGERASRKAGGKSRRQNEKDDHEIDKKVRSLQKKKEERKKSKRMTHVILGERGREKKEFGQKGKNGKKKKQRICMRRYASQNEIKFGGRIISKKKAEDQK